MPCVLVVEDETAVRYALRLLFLSHGLEVVEAASPDEATSVVSSRQVDVVVQDMNFVSGATSGEEGIALFRRLRALVPELPIVLLTAWANVETAVLLTKEGATDYVAKPWNEEKLVGTVKTHLQVGVVARDRMSVDTCGAVFKSAAMKRVVALAATVAKEPFSVLVLGPNGSGKEKIAEIIQRNSPRRDAPFVRVNAGALPDALLEAELFGAEAGAFTGATKTRLGRFEEADGGTLFLDEIGNLSLAGQMRLLRVLQTGEFQRLGSTRTRRVDVRLVSATNLDVHAAVRSGAFREDLLYRINVFELRIPPLAERREDVVPIAETLLVELARERGREPLRLTPAAARLLESHPWPGNVRELRNALTRAVVLASSSVLDVDHLGLVAAGARLPAAPRAAPPSSRKEPTIEMLQAALARANGNVRAVALELGISRQTLYRRLERAGIDLDAYRDGEREDGES